MLLGIRVKSDRSSQDRVPKRRLKKKKNCWSLSSRWCQGQVGDFPSLGAECKMQVSGAWRSQTAVVLLNSVSNLGRDQPGPDLVRAGRTRVAKVWAVHLASVVDLVIKSPESPGCGADIQGSSLHSNP